MDQVERIYIRFKGRVLGPLTQAKAAEMVRRGQITKQHELSSDGQTWRPAEEFTALFAPSKAKVDSETRTPAATPGVIPDGQLAIATPLADEDWYANFDGTNQGPTSEQGMRAWIAAGKVRPDTMVWKSGMENWLEARHVGGAWFGPQYAKRSDSPYLANTAQAPTEGSEELERIGALLVKSSRWAQFVGILGIILCTLALIILGFGSLAFAFSPALPGEKLAALIFAVIYIGFLVMFLICAIGLTRYAFSVNVLRFRSRFEDITHSLACLSQLWTTIGITTLIWLVLTVGSILFAFVLGVSLAFLSQLR